MKDKIRYIERKIKNIDTLKERGFEFNPFTKLWYKKE